MCVNPEHLKLGTAQENTDMMMAQGTAHFHKGHNHTVSGEDNYAAKLTQAQVDEIRLRYTGKSGEQNDLAAEFGVTQTCIWNVLSGKTWKLEKSEGMVARHARIAAEKERVKLPFPMRGEISPSHKLSNEQVNEIRSKYTGKRGQQSALAREYGVRQGTIWYIVNHITWNG
jgi:predicted DNA-binding protein (UPF0251 family)